MPVRPETRAAQYSMNTALEVPPTPIYPSDEPQFSEDSYTIRSDTPRTLDGSRFVVPSMMQTLPPIPTVLVTPAANPPQQQQTNDAYWFEFVCCRSSRVAPTVLPNLAEGVDQSNEDNCCFPAENNDGSRIYASLPLIIGGIFLFLVISFVLYLAIKTGSIDITKN